MPSLFFKALKLLLNSKDTGISKRSQRLIIRSQLKNLVLFYTFIFFHSATARADCIKIFHQVFSFQRLKQAAQYLNVHNITIQEKQKLSVISVIIGKKKLYLQWCQTFELMHKINGCIKYCLYIVSIYRY